MSDSIYRVTEVIGTEGVIPFTDVSLGGHAFAIVAYDERGLWIQNSWGTAWGLDGFACLTYDDWLENGTDVWVARLGAPVILRTTCPASSVTVSTTDGFSSSSSFRSLSHPGNGTGFASLTSFCSSSRRASAAPFIPSLR